MRKFKRIKKGNVEHEISLIKLGDRFKVTRRTPSVNASDTEFFGDEKKAKKRFKKLVEDLK